MNLDPDSNEPNHDVPNPGGAWGQGRSSERGRGDRGSSFKPLNPCVEKAFRELLAKPGGQLVGHLLLAMAHRNAGNFEEAIAHCEVILAKATDLLDRARGYLMRGEIAQNMGCPEDAVRFHRLGLGVGCPNPRTLACLWGSLASGLNQLGRWEEAGQAARQGIASRSDYPEPHRQLAISFEKRGEMKEAAREFVEALMAKPQEEKHIQEIRRLHRDCPGLLESDPGTWIVASLWLGTDEPSRPWQVITPTKRMFSPEEHP